METVRSAHGIEWPTTAPTVPTADASSMGMKDWDVDWSTIEEPERRRLQPLPKPSSASSSQNAVPAQYEKTKPPRDSEVTVINVQTLASRTTGDDGDDQDMEFFTTILPSR